MYVVVKLCKGFTELHSFVHDDAERLLIMVIAFFELRVMPKVTSVADMITVRLTCGKQRPSFFLK